MEIVCNLGFNYKGICSLTFQEALQSFGCPPDSAVRDLDVDRGRCFWDVYERSKDLLSFD